MTATLGTSIRPGCLNHERRRAIGASIVTAIYIALLLCAPLLIRYAPAADFPPALAKVAPVQTSTLSMPPALAFAT